MVSRNPDSSTSPGGPPHLLTPRPTSPTFVERTTSRDRLVTLVVRRLAILVGRHLPEWSQAARSELRVGPSDHSIWVMPT
jgi:hypothetical protein